MSKLVVLPTVDNNTQPTYHLKSDYPQINFSEFNVKRDYDLEEKTLQKIILKFTLQLLILFLLKIQKVFVVSILFLLLK